MNTLYYTNLDKENAHEFLFFILDKYYNLQITDKDLKKTEFGKLYIENNPIYFNISHSQNVVAIAISNENVGVDVEVIKDKKFSNINKNVFGNEILKKEDFFALWTKAESFVKYNANSILLSLKHIIIKEDKIYYDNLLQNVNITTKKIDDFFASVASLENDFNVVKVDY
ncbi:MAG: hypothetical protein E7342_05205 [Clostridiales bacterium]|nr:hypothetical protein [Clostridiales bacterium]